MKTVNAPKLLGNSLQIVPQLQNYRTAAITKGFAWQQIVRDIRQTRSLDTAKLYLVVFRSVRRPDVDGAWISQLDEAAHQEALQSSALLHYFAGHLDGDRRAMSWCLWTEQAAARQALSGPAHQEAVREARVLYESFAIELYNVHLANDGEILFEPAQRHAH